MLPRKASRKRHCFLPRFTHYNDSEFRIGVGRKWNCCSAERRKSLGKLLVEECGNVLACGGSNMRKAESAWRNSAQFFLHVSNEFPRFLTVPHFSKWVPRSWKVISAQSCFRFRPSIIIFNIRMISLRRILYSEHAAGRWEFWNDPESSTVDLTFPTQNSTQPNHSNTWKWWYSVNLKEKIEKNKDK